MVLKRKMSYFLVFYMLSNRAILDKLVQCLFLSLLLNTCPVFSTTVDTIIKEMKNILTNGKYLNILYHRHMLTARK